MTSQLLFVITSITVLFLCIYSHCLTLAVREHMNATGIAYEREVVLPTWVKIALIIFSLVCTGIIYLFTALIYNVISRFAFLF